MQQPIILWSCPFVKSPKRQLTTHFGMLRQSHTQHHMHSVNLIFLKLDSLAKSAKQINLFKIKTGIIYHLNFHSQFLWLSATNRNSINCVVWITCIKSHVKWLAFHCSNWIAILKKQTHCWLECTHQFYWISIC